MAYYAALVPLVQLLKDITHHDHPYSDEYYIVLENYQQLHLSVFEKFNLLQELLDDYSRKDLREDSADLLESRIRDVACDAQDIIESHVSDLFSEQIEEDIEKKYYEELEKVKAEVDSIVEEMLSIKMERLATHENNSAGAASTQVPRNVQHTTTKAGPCGESSNKLEAVPIVEVESLTTHQNNLQEIRYSANTGVASTQRIDGGLVPLVQLLEEMSHYNPDFSLDIAQIASLHEKFKQLQQLLDKEESPVFLERRIRNVSDRTEHIILTHISNQKHGDLRLNEYQDIKKVEKEVSSIVEEMIMRIKMESLTTQEEGSHQSSYIRADSFGGAPKVEPQSGTSTMVGFEEQLIAIKDKLCGGPYTHAREVVSIVGMGGMGKTTLARNIFEDKFINEYFDLRAWVTISQDYHLPKVLLDIANSMNITEKGRLAENIYKHLFGMRYLIVIDDLWDIEIWNDIKWIFPNNSNGSRIMVTTRLSDVALYVGNSVGLHDMQFLNEDQSWTLLKQKVFAQKNCPEDLEVIGKLIARNCRGLPLGIVVIAGVLSNVRKVQHDWKEIARQVRAIAIDQNDKRLSNILSLSYNHLPHRLKPCFLSFGGLPEDHDIRISQLINLWVVEGFLRPIESKSVEEVGEEYLKDLANRNLVFFTKKKFDGKFKYCRVHDLVRDLCSQRAHYENFLHCPREDDVYHKSIGNVHRVFASENSLFLKYPTKHYSTIRSEDFYGSAFSINEILANKIFELVHLRYLTLNAESDIHISASICKLWNLQTLIVDGISVSLPCEIWKMPQLRHLIMISRYGARIPPIPYGEISIIDGVPLLGRLQKLQGLHDFIFTHHTIKMIPSLKKLTVYYTSVQDESYASWEEVALSNLVHLHQLEKLKIFFHLTKPRIPLPENFAFPSSLTKLTLMCCELSWKDMSVVGSLPNLQVLKLRWDAFVGEKWEPIEGEFLKLKSLLMDRLSDLKYWRAEHIHFPCLERLHIKGCYKLEEIPLEIGDIPTLQVIEVIECNSSLELSTFKIQEEQRDIGNDDLQVRVVSRLKPRGWFSSEQDESNSEEEDEDESNTKEYESKSEEEDASNSEEEDELMLEINKLMADSVLPEEIEELRKIFSRMMLQLSILHVGG